MDGLRALMECADVQGLPPQFSHRALSLPPRLGATADRTVVSAEFCGIDWNNR
jgi:hypothetical protein